MKLFRGIVQLVERRSPKPNVVSSSLATPAKTIVRYIAIYHILSSKIY